MADLAQGISAPEPSAADVHRRLLVHELFGAFAHRVDDGDLRGWSELFTDDAVMITSQGVHHVGRNAIYQMITASHQEHVRGPGRHLIVNVEIVSLQPGSAKIEADTIYVVGGPDSSDIKMVARYLCDLVWRSDRWKIARQRVDTR